MLRAACRCAWPPLPVGSASNWVGPPALILGLGGGVLATPDVLPSSSWLAGGWAAARGGTCHRKGWHATAHPRLLLSAGAPAIPQGCNVTNAEALGRPRRLAPRSCRRWRWTCCGWGTSSSSRCPSASWKLTCRPRGRCRRPCAPPWPCRSCPPPCRSRRCCRPRRSQRTAGLAGAAPLPACEPHRRRRLLPLVRLHLTGQRWAARHRRRCRRLCCQRQLWPRDTCPYRLRQRQQRRLEQQQQQQLPVLWCTGLRQTSGKAAGCRRARGTPAWGTGCRTCSSCRSQCHSKCRMQRRCTARAGAGAGAGTHRCGTEKGRGRYMHGQGLVPTSGWGGGAGRRFEARAPLRATERRLHEGGCIRYIVHYAVGGGGGLAPPPPGPATPWWRTPPRARPGRWQRRRRGPRTAPHARPTRVGRACRRRGRVAAGGSPGRPCSACDRRLGRSVLPGKEGAQLGMLVECGWHLCIQRRPRTCLGPALVNPLQASQADGPGTAHTHTPPWS